MVVSLLNECRSLTEESKKLLTQYGSSLISNVRFRDNFIMIGQKGLAEGSAVEQVLNLLNFLLHDPVYLCSVWFCFSYCMYCTKSVHAGATRNLWH